MPVQLHVVVEPAAMHRVTDALELVVRDRERARDPGDAPSDTTRFNFGNRMNCPLNIQSTVVGWATKFSRVTGTRIGDESSACMRDRRLIAPVTPRRCARVR